MMPMDAARWQRLRGLLDSALDLDNSEHAAFVAALPTDAADLRDELRELLACHARNESQRTLDPVELAAPWLLEDEHAEEISRVGGWIGAFHVLRLIGTGGMGAVYLAERKVDNFVHRVALKVMREGSPSAFARERFERERQILADLVHPHIGTLFEGGQTDEGQPYYTMEFVDGVPITDYCRDHALGVPQRLRLLLDVAAALSHAHQNLIVHRDVKPSNVLVSTDGRVKLLDFGIAKNVGKTDAAATQPAQGLMTPEYAAPEQFRGGAVTVATDIYQFGVLCFRVLTGSLPYRADPADRVAWAMAVTSDDPNVLSRSLDTQPGGAWKDPDSLRVKRQLSQDLDAIVRKALAKNPQDRYRSMDAVILDLEAFLAGRPVSARRAGAWYFARRFIARKPYAVATAAAAVIALASVALVAVQQARVARDEADRANAVASFLTEMFQVADPGVNRGERLNANEILERGASRLDKELATQPVQRARLQSVIGEVFSLLGDYPRARPLLANAVASLQEAGPSFDLGHSLRLLAWVDYRQGDAQAALHSLDTAVPLVQGNSVHEHMEQTSVHSNRGLVEQTLSHFDVARAEFEIALAAARDAGVPGRAKVAAAENNLGLLYREMGNLPAARSMLQRALQDYRREYGEAHWRSLSTAQNLGLVLTDLKDYPGALALIEPTLGPLRDQLGESNADYATAANMLGSVYRRSGDFDNALKYYAVSERAFRAALGDHHPYLAWPIGNEGRVLMARHDAAGALEKFSAALALQRAGLEAKHLYQADSLSARSHALMALQRYPEATADAEEALAIRRLRLPADHADVVENLWDLGLVHYAQGDLVQAHKAWDEAMERAPRAYTADSDDLVQLRRDVAAPDAALKAAMF
jgi:tetratricopeptide (TPR) repeat protein